MKYLGRRHAAEPIVIAFLIVFNHPGPGHIPHLIKRLKQPSIQHFRPMAPIEAFDIDVLIGLSRLNITDRNPVVLTPIIKIGAQALRHFVGAQDGR